MLFKLENVDIPMVTLSYAPVMHAPVAQILVIGIIVV